MATLIATTPAGDLRVLVIADDPLARAGLSSLLADQPACTVVGQVAGDDQLVDNIGVYSPSIVLWDLGWTPALALERLADLRDLSLNVVALLPDDSAAPGAWTAGARGLLFRNSSVEKLVAAMASVVQGMIVLDPALGGLMLASRDRPAIAPGSELTAREVEVLQLLAEGMPNKAIAKKLSISEHTVKFHVNAILGKLGVQSRTEAVVRANRLGLIIL